MSDSWMLLSTTAWVSVQVSLFINKLQTCIYVKLNFVILYTKERSRNWKNWIKDAFLDDPDCVVRKQKV